VLLRELAMAEEAEYLLGITRKITEGSNAAHNRIFMFCFVDLFND
jgi:hypothetical protein